MSEREKSIISKIAEVMPKMSEFDKGYLLGKAETLADENTKKRETKMDANNRLDEIVAKAEQVKNMIGLTHQDDVTSEQFTEVLYIVSDYLIDIIGLAEGR